MTDLKLIKRSVILVVVNLITFMIFTGISFLSVMAVLYRVFNFEINYIPDIYTIASIYGMEQSYSLYFLPFVSMIATPLLFVMIPEVIRKDVFFYSEEEIGPKDLKFKNYLNSIHVIYKGNSWSYGYGEALRIDKWIDCKYKIMLVKRYSYNKIELCTYSSLRLA